MTYSQPTISDMFNVNTSTGLGCLLEQHIRIEKKTKKEGACLFLGIGRSVWTALLLKEAGVGTERRIPFARYEISLLRIRLLVG